MNLKLWQGGWQAVHDKTLGEFEWSLGLGANTFSYVFYFLTNPFFWITCLFPKSFIPYSVLVFQILTMWLSTVIGFIWLKKLTGSDTGAMIGAIILGFCSYNYFYMQVEQILKLGFLYPLILYFSECFLCEGKWKGLLFSIAFTGITNYYVLYQFAPFLIIYILLRYFWLRKVNKAASQSFWKTGLCYFGVVLLAIGLCAFVLVPVAKLILSMSRFTNVSVNWYDHLDRWQIYRIVTSLFCPTFEKLDANLFINVSLVNIYGWSGGAPLYSLILTPLFAPLVFQLKNKQTKKFCVIFLLLLVFFTIFPVFSYLFQFTIDTRWYYMYPFLFAIVVSFVFDGFEAGEITPHSVYLSCGVTLLLMWSAFGFSCFYQLNSLDNLNKLAIILLILSFMAILYVFIVTKIFSRKLFLIGISFECILSGLFFYTNNSPIDAKVYEEPVINSDIGTYLLDRDSGFYRVQYDNEDIFLKNSQTSEDTLSLMTGNEPFANGYNGFGFYESVYNTEQEEFLWRLKSSWNMTQMMGRTNTYNMLSSKYWYTFDHSNPVPYGYSLVYESPNGYDLYENTNYVELGFAYSQTVSSEYLLSQSFIEQDRIMSEYLVTENRTNTDCDLHDNLTFLATLPAEDIRTYTFSEPIKDVTLYIETFGLPETKITLLYQGKEVANYDAWQFNYIDFPIYEFVDQIIIDAPAVYGKQTEINLYISQHDGSYEKQWSTTTANHFTNVQYQGDHIDADINISYDTPYVFTSIPYDKGWTVTVDGEQIEYSKVQLGFIGFELQPGQHHISFTYHVPGLKTGMIVSAFCAFIVLLLLIIPTRKK